MRLGLLIAWLITVACCTSAAMAGSFVDPYLYGSGYWDPTTGRLWEPVDAYEGSLDNGWDSLAGVYYDPVTGDQLGCTGPSCTMWASSADVLQVFDDIDHVPQGTPFADLNTAVLFRKFGSSLADPYECPPDIPYADSFANYIGAGIARDRYLIVSGLSASPCGSPNASGEVQAFQISPNFGDDSFGAYIYQQFSTPEPATPALLVTGMLALILAQRRRRKAAKVGSLGP